MTTPFVPLRERNPTRKFSGHLGKCPECSEQRTGYKWCHSCYSKHFKENSSEWTSGNKEIDNFIRDIQLNATERSNCLEWVPSEMFTDLTFIAKGGFGSVYKATWLNGPIQEWDPNEKCWIRDTQKEDRVIALKSLDNSDNITTDFLEEIKIYIQCGINPIIMRCKGITKHGETGNYMMIMDYAYGGSLRKYLSENFYLFDWWKKLNLARDIAEGLYDMHDKNFVHHDFHSGNVLYNGSWACISDLGLCRPANSVKTSKVVYGVLPYLAPEVIKGKPYTQESDIYSLGIILWELSCAKIPFGDKAHDVNLALDICGGSRPEFNDDVPQCYIDLVNKCWDGNPSNRPKASEILYTIEEWWESLIDGKSSVEVSQFILADSKKQEIDDNLPTELNIRQPMNPFHKIHQDAVYHSRLLEFPIFSQNQSNDTPQDISRGLDSHQIDLGLPDDFDFEKNS